MSIEIHSLHTNTHTFSIWKYFFFWVITNRQLNIVFQVNFVILHIWYPVRVILLQTEHITDLAVCKQSLANCNDRWHLYNPGINDGLNAMSALQTWQNNFWKYICNVLTKQLEVRHRNLVGWNTRKSSYLVEMNTQKEVNTWTGSDVHWMIFPLALGPKELSVSRGSSVCQTSCHASPLVYKSNFSFKIKTLF